MKKLVLLILVAICSFGTSGTAQTWQPNPKYVKTEGTKAKSESVQCNGTVNDRKTKTARQCKLKGKANVGNMYYCRFHIGQSK